MKLIFRYVKQRCHVNQLYTRSSATADGPRDATCQSKSCQLLHNSVGTTCRTSPEQIEVMELEGYSRPTYNKLVHSATTCSTVVGVIHKLIVVGVVYELYRRRVLLIIPIHRRRKRISAFSIHRTGFACDQKCKCCAERKRTN